ncbi:MAG: NADH-quinone oxidoreductase subunit D-related protein [Candidatus Hodarchaeales archaeon]|jgi:hypothetical protein
MQKSAETERIDLNSVNVMPSTHENLVKGIISQDYKKFWNQNNEINIEIQNKSMEETYSILTDDHNLDTLSRQIQLSESLEIISGFFIDEKLRMFRGFLLNLEKISLFFFLYKRLADIYDIETLLELSSLGLNTNNHTFTDLWGNSFPHKMVRPGWIEEEISESSISKIRNNLKSQQKLVKNIRKAVKNSKTLQKPLENYSNLIETEILKSGITGPLARSVNVITPLINASTSINHFSSSQFSQFVTSESSNPFGLLEICNVELTLALERMLQLLPKIYGRILLTEGELRNGSISSSFVKSFGVDSSYLSKLVTSSVFPK